MDFGYKKIFRNNENLEKEANVIHEKYEMKKLKAKE